MAVNSAIKRSSMLNYGTDSTLLPEPDGSFGLEDRTQLLGLYVGISILVPEAAEEEVVDTQDINFGSFFSHNVQSVSGWNVGVELEGDWTDVLRIDARLFKNVAVTMYNQDGADACQVRVIGTLLDDDEDEEPDADDVSWATEDAVYPSTELLPATQTEVIRASGSYTWLKVQARTSDSVLLNGYYRGVN